MPKNSNSSSGAAEDMIRAFVQMGCAEVHLMTLYQKTYAEMENGLVDMSDEKVRKDMLEKAEQYREDLIRTADLRRQMMLKCFDMFDDGDKDVWCMVKHLGISSMCAWEVWQASDDDPDLLYLAVEANKLFTRFLSQFLGTTVTDCASCFADALKGAEHGKMKVKE